MWVFSKKGKAAPSANERGTCWCLAQVTLERTFPPEHRFCHELSTKCVRAPSVVAIASAVTLMLRSMRWQEREGRLPFVEPEPRRDARQSAAVIRGKANAPSGWRWRLQPRSSVCRVGAFFVLVKTKAPDSESSDEPIRSRRRRSGFPARINPASA